MDTGQPTKLTSILDEVLGNDLYKKLGHVIVLCNNGPFLREIQYDVALDNRRLGSRVIFTNLTFFNRDPRRLGAAVEQAKIYCFLAIYRTLIRCLFSNRN